MMQNMVITVIVAASIYAVRDSFKAWPPGVNIRIPNREGDPEEKDATASLLSRMESFSLK